MLTLTPARTEVRWRGRDAGLWMLWPTTACHADETWTRACCVFAPLSILQARLARELKCSVRGHPLLAFRPVLRRPSGSGRRCLRTNHQQCLRKELHAHGLVMYYDRCRLARFSGYGLSTTYSMLKLTTVCLYSMESIVQSDSFLSSRDMAAVWTRCKAR